MSPSESVSSFELYKGCKINLLISRFFELTGFATCQAETVSLPHPPPLVPSISLLNIGMERRRC